MADIAALIEDGGPPRRRAAAAKASASFREQLDSSPLSSPTRGKGAFSENQSVPARRQYGGRPRRGMEGSTSKRLVNSTSISDVSDDGAGPASSKGLTRPLKRTASTRGRGRGATMARANGNHSTSSAIVSRSIKAPSPSSIPLPASEDENDHAPTTKITASRSQVNHKPAADATSVPVPSTPATNGKKRPASTAFDDSPVSIYTTTPSKTPPHPNHARFNDGIFDFPPKWSLPNEEHFAWLCLTNGGRAHCETEVLDGFRGEKDVVWWPAKVHDARSKPRFAELLGDHPSFAPTPKISISAPSASNIQSFYNARGNVRFNALNFTIPHPLLHPEDSLGASPRKRHKSSQSTGRNLVQRWEAAKALADEDGLPDTDAFVVPGNARVPSNPKDRSPTKPAKQPAQLDLNLDIPGEKVLARDHPNSTACYPALVEEFNAEKSHKPYRVRFMDERSKWIKRVMFYTFSDPGFLECEMGAFNTEVGGRSIKDIEDEDDVDDSPLKRERSPSPDAPEIGSWEDFDDELDVRQQFALVKPIMQAALQGRYAPVEGKHMAFMKGGAWRVGLSQGASQAGDLNALQISNVRRYLERWALRDELLAKGKVLQEEIAAEVEGAQMKVDEPNLAASERVEEAGKHDEDEAFASETLAAETLLSLSATPKGPPSSFDATAKSSSTIQALSSPGLEGSEETLAVANNEGPRQCGSEDYENLDPLAKSAYVSDILLPLAYNQILLWKNGDRTSYQLLGNDEELALYHKGEELRQQTYWVSDIANYKTLMEQTRKFNKGKSLDQRSSPSKTARGSRSRLVAL